MTPAIGEVPPAGVQWWKPAREVAKEQRVPLAPPRFVRSQRHLYNDKMLNRDNRGSHTGCAGIIGSDCNGGGNAQYNVVSTYRTDLLQYKCTAPGVSEPRNERFSRERRYAIYVKQA